MYIYEKLLFLVFIPQPAKDPKRRILISESDPLLLSPL